MCKQSVLRKRKVPRPEVNPQPLAW